MLLQGQMEAVSIELLLAECKNMYILALYRPPRGGSALSEFVSDLDSALSCLSASRNQLCVTSDFNAKSSNWWVGQMPNEAEAVLSASMTDHNLAQLVKGPTRCDEDSFAT